MFNKNNNPKKTDNSFIFGFATGLITFLAFDFLRDSKKRKELISDIKYLEKEAKPYVKEFREYLVQSPDVRKAVRSIDALLGSDIEGYIKTIDKELEEEKDVKKTTSIKKFFKFKNK